MSSSDLTEADEPRRKVLKTFKGANIDKLYTTPTLKSNFAAAYVSKSRSSDGKKTPFFVILCGNCTTTELVHYSLYYYSKCKRVGGWGELLGKGLTQSATKRLKASEE